MRALTAAVSIMILAAACVLLPRYARSAEAPGTGTHVSNSMPGDKESVVVVQRSKIHELFTIPMLPLWICSLVYSATGL